MTESIEEKVRRTRAEQGLPERIEDPAALAQVVTHVAPFLRERQECETA